MKVKQSKMEYKMLEDSERRRSAAGGKDWFVILECYDIERLFNWIAQKVDQLLPVIKMDAEAGEKTFLPKKTERHVIPLV